MVEPVKGVEETVIFSCVLNEETVESLTPVNAPLESEDILFVDVSVFIDWLKAGVVSTLGIVVDPVFSNVVPKVSPDKLGPSVISLVIEVPVSPIEIVWVNDVVDSTVSPDIVE